jgi:hypothetical protein
MSDEELADYQLTDLAEHTMIRDIGDCSDPGCCVVHYEYVCGKCRKNWPCPASKLAGGSDCLTPKSGDGGGVPHERP